MRGEESHCGQAGDKRGEKGPLYAMQDRKKMATVYEAGEEVCVCEDLVGSSLIYPLRLV